MIPIALFVTYVAASPVLPINFAAAYGIEDVLKPLRNLQVSISLPDNYPSQRGEETPVEHSLSYFTRNEVPTQLFPSL